MKIYKKKYHNVETVSKYNRKIVERDKFDTSNRHIHTGHFSGFIPALQ